MEGSEQRGDTPDLGVYRHPLETAEATVGGGVGGGLGGIRKLGAVMVPGVDSEDQTCGSIWHSFWQQGTLHLMHGGVKVSSLVLL